MINLNFEKETLKILKYGGKAETNGEHFQIPGVLTKIKEAIRKRLEVNGNPNNVDDYYEIEGNRIKIAIPTFTNKTTEHNTHHKIVIQVEEHLESEKKLEAIARSIKSDVGQKTKKADSGTVIVIAKDYGEEIMENYELDQLHGIKLGRYNKLVLKQSNNPAQSIYNILHLLKAFYKGRAEAIDRKEKERIAISKKFGGWFGVFGRCIKAFKKFIVTFPEAILSKLRKMIKTIAKYLNNGKSTDIDSDVDAIRDYARMRLDRMLGGG